MLFNSHLFLFIFLPVVLIAFYTVPPNFRLAVLLVSSLVFYGMAGTIPLIFMIASISWAFVTAFIFRRFHNRLGLAFAVMFPLAVLFLFRYLDFTLDSLNLSEEERQPFQFFLSVILPAGISFYTFQIVSYSIDVFDRREPVEKNALKLATFISFFPQLIAGPILRYGQIAGQLERISSERHLSPDFVGGIKFISVGLFAKIFFADFLSKPQERFSVIDNTSSLDALFAILAYSFRIYYDFWAYSIIAIGLAKLFSISLPRNFEEPYLSLNPKDFWRRWHITLSYWIRDYVYIKLGGRERRIRNIIIAFLVVGLWHGAGWNFVLWGALHAIYVLVYDFLEKPWSRMPQFFQVLLTFSLVTLAWPLFFLGFEEYLMILDQLFITGSFTSVAYGLKQWAYLAVVAIWLFLMRESRWLFNEAPARVFDSPILYGLLLTMSVLFFSWGETFIYFRF